MARLDKISSSYAKAIYDYLADPAKVRKLVDELNGFASLLNGSAELKQALTTQVFAEEKRAAVVEDLCGKLKVSADARRVLLVLSRMGRLGHVTGIAQKLHLLVLEAAGTVPLHVETAAALEAGEKTKIEQKFHKLLGKNVEADYVVDPNLIGGLRVTAAGRTYDGTLSGWLGVIEQKLAGGTI